MIHGTYVGHDRVLVRTAWNGRFLLPARDRSFLPWLIFDGVLEEPATRYCLEYVQPGWRCLDVGAAFGYFTVLLAHRVGDQGSVVALEPHPEMADILQENLALNSVLARVRVLPVAAAAAAGEAPLHVAREFTGNSSLRRHADWYEDHYGDVREEHQVSTIAIQDRFPDGFDLIKMDIEGGEFAAFRGAEKLVKRGRVRQVLFELNHRALAEDLEPLRRLLRGWERRYGAMFHFLDAAGRPHPIALDALFEHEFVPAALMVLG